jgi:ABC-type uncharacterized transport system substrate-binding protein
LFRHGWLCPLSPKADITVSRYFFGDRKITKNGRQNSWVNPKFTGFNSLWKVIEDIAPRQGIAAHSAYASRLAEIVHAFDVTAKHVAAGLIVNPSPVNTVNRKRICSLANESKIPAIFPFRFYVGDRALLAYGFDAADQFKRAAIHVDRILKGERAGDLPVQGPSLFEFGVKSRDSQNDGACRAAIPPNRGRRNRPIVLAWLS